MVIELVAMSQRLTVMLDVEDSLVRVTFTLPGMLGFMAGAIAGAVRKKGGQLLLN